jgi:hypothetical protein
MKVIINFKPQPSPGYEPRKSVQMFNVAGVEDAGPSTIRLRMQFTDDQPTYDHVISVSVTPEREE